MGMMRLGFVILGVCETRVCDTGDDEIRTSNILCFLSFILLSSGPSTTTPLLKVCNNEIDETRVYETGYDETRVCDTWKCNETRESETGDDETLVTSLTVSQTFRRGVVILGEDANSIKTKILLVLISSCAVSQTQYHHPHSHRLKSHIPVVSQTLLSQNSSSTNPCLLIHSLIDPSLTYPKYHKPLSHHPQSHRP